MSTYDHLTIFFGTLGTTLQEVAWYYGYSAENLAALNGDLDLLKEKYPETYENLMLCAHQKDSRSYSEYGQSLVSNWVFEDYKCKALIRAGCNIELAGADKDRRILPSSKVSNASDYIVHMPDGTARKLELVCDYTGFCQKTGCLDLRDHKYQHLLEDGSLLLVIDIPNRRFCIIDFKNFVEATKIEKHPLWDKPAYRIGLANNVAVSGIDRARYITRALYSPIQLIAKQ